MQYFRFIWHTVIIEACFMDANSSGDCGIGSSWVGRRTCLQVKVARVILELLCACSFTKPSRLICFTEFGNFTFTFRRTGPTKRSACTSPAVHWRPITTSMKALASSARSTPWTTSRWLRAKMCWSIGRRPSTWITPNVVWWTELKIS